MKQITLIPKGQKEKTPDNRTKRTHHPVATIYKPTARNLIPPNKEREREPTKHPSKANFKGRQHLKQTPASLTSVYTKYITEKP